MLIDGEHQPSVVADALVEVAQRHEVVAVAFVGGGEKVAPETLAEPPASYGYELFIGDSPPAAMLAAITATKAELVIDLADEPVVDAAERVRLAGLALAAGLDYLAPGMELSAAPSNRPQFAGPTVAIVGTAKRTGKTAVCGHLAMILKQFGASPAIVSMGRGGPAEPMIARPPVTIDDLLAITERGDHAASDYLEGAALAGVMSIGCRRIGGGIAGETAYTNFERGIEQAARISEVDTLLLEGSGATLPPSVAARTITIVGSADQARMLTGPGRIAQADLVLVRADRGTSAIVEARAWTEAPIAGFRLVPTAISPPPADARVAVFTTGAPAVDGVDAVVTSVNLARRELLADDLERAKRERCDHYLIELKAAAIDVIAASARADGVAVSLVRNRPVSDDADLDGLLLNVWKEAADE